MCEVRQITLPTVVLFAATLAAQQAPPDVDAIFRDYATTTAPGCAVGVARGTTPVFAKAYGLADLEHGVPLTPQSVFYMASVSKQFMALAVLLLEQDGKIRLDDRARQYVPELPDHASPIRIRQLLHHTSGLRDYLTLSALAGHPPDYVLTEHAVLQMLARQARLNFEPGAEHLYSNSGYVVLSIVVQRVTGRPLDEFARERIFAPLGMTRTRFQHDHAAPIPGRAAGYQRRGQAWRIANSPLDVVGDGGLYSTVDDMLRWAAAFERPDFAPLLARMQTPGTLADGRAIANGYGMGLTKVTYRGLETVAHGGALAGYRTIFFRLPSERLTIVTLCNTSAAAPPRLAQQVAEAFAGGAMATASTAAATPPPFAPALAELLPAAEAQALAGTYYSAELDAAYRIAFTDQRLTVAAGTAAPVELERLAPLGERFRFAPAGAELVPTRAASGRVTGLTLNAGRVRGIVFVRK